MRQLASGRRRVVGRLILALVALAAGPSWLPGIARAQGEQAAEPTAVSCDGRKSNAVVTAAYKVPRDQPTDEELRRARATRDNDVELGDVVALEVENFGSLIAERDCRDESKRIVLFLDGRPITALTAFPPTDPDKGVVHFTLRRSDESRTAWAEILGRPSLKPRTVPVSLGIEDRHAVETRAKLDLLIVPTNWLLGWLGVFAAMVGTFFWLIRSSNILRDGRPDPVTGAWNDGTYSLAKSQGAWWFFVVLASYLLIGMITGDFSTTMNGTVLTLLGIGAGTVVLSAVIDASKASAGAVATERAAAGIVEAEVQALEASKSPPADIAAAMSVHRKLTGRSEGFLTDILSDVNGVSFHRFQIAAWTVVLSVIFVKEVYQGLAMPSFDATLLTLQGISAGTYLGLKIPEPTVPQKA